MDKPSPIPSTPHHRIYTAPTGYFLQSLPTTNDRTFPALAPLLGLIDQPYPEDEPSSSTSRPWPRLLSHLHALNANASSSGTSHRLLLLARHGQGYHNVAEAFLGTAAWDCFYSTLDGSEALRWADAELTALGVGQAESAGRFLRALVEDEGGPVPGAWYVSPLRRAVRTAGVALGEVMGVEGDGRREGKLVVKENLREGIGIHTCDRRSSRRQIQEEFPEVVIEEGFAEEDQQWDAELREPGAAQTIRLRGVLDDIFATDESLVISLTSHGGTIQSILRAVGHREFNVGTGGIIPVVVKVEVVSGRRGEEREIRWEAKPECEGGEPSEEEVRERLRKLDESVKGGGA